jgi:cold-inducible RNA-binding protein
LLIALADSIAFFEYLEESFMGNKLYVGNLPYSFRDEDMQQAFSQFGNVSSAKVMMERDTGRSKGFGFVEMGSDAEAQAAIKGMNGQNMGGRDLVVNEARPMEPRPPVAVVAAATVVVAAAVVTAVAVAAAVVVMAVAAVAVTAVAVAAATKHSVCGVFNRKSPQTNKRPPRGLFFRLRRPFAGLCPEKHLHESRVSEP